MKKSLILLATLGVFAGTQALADESLPAKVGDAVKRGGEAAGHGIEKAADATGRGIRKGGEATVRGLDTAGHWVEKKLHGSDENSAKGSESK